MTCGVLHRLARWFPPASLLAAATFAAGPLMAQAQLSQKALVSQEAVAFRIDAGDLSEALNLFGEQTGLHIVYRRDVITGRLTHPVVGAMSASEALDRLLETTQLQWRAIGERTIVIEVPAAAGLTASRAASSAPDRAGERDVVTLEEIISEANAIDFAGVLPLEPIDSVLGLEKRLLETPRAVSVLSDDLMDSYGIESALDVAKVVPGAYTTSIFGINGNVNLRAGTSDTYFRGIKRLENTQLFPSPITAMSRVDVIRGPPSPLSGPGKGGGYTNFVPKSARASTGKYLDDPMGEIELSGGSYERKAAALEFGGAAALGSAPVGYYVYSSAEESETYYDNVPFAQYIVQSSFDAELSGGVRFEFGQMFQLWRGVELAGWNRVTQQLIDSGLYQAGELLVDLDANRDGLIATSEVDAYGALLRTFPGNADPAYVASALQDHWRLDPATTALVPLARDATAQTSEDGGEARVNLAYFDVIVEFDDGARLTNKLYAEKLDRFKWTRASAYGQDTHSRVIEEKIIYQRPFQAASGARVNVGVSGMHRYYDTINITGSKYNDLVNRPDISRPDSARNRFAVPNLEPSLAPWNTGLDSTYTTSGVGALADVNIGKTNLIVGARYDWLSVDSSIPDFVLTTPGASVHGTDEGLSWSASLSHEIARDVRPYITYARQQTLIHGIDGGIGVTVAPDALNEVELREAGLKWSALNGALFVAANGYRQTRREFSAETTQTPSIQASGWELEMRWAVNKRFSLTCGGAWQRARYVPLRPVTVMVGPETFGIEHDYYGGRLQAILPADDRFARRSGYPDEVMNLNTTYLLTHGLALDVSLAHHDEMKSGRTQTLVLPSATILGASLTYETPRFEVRIAAGNLTNEEYFLPNSPDVTGELIVIPAPERNFRTSVTLKF